MSDGSALVWSQVEKWGVSGVVMCRVTVLFVISCAKCSIVVQTCCANMLCKHKYAVKLGMDETKLFVLVIR